jgi:hypothetical protein
MSCPNCKAEYRVGFTHCSDSDVDLIASLDEQEISSHDPNDSGRPELLWTGMHKRMLARIEGALESATIPYRQRHRDVAALPGYSEPVYAILTHARDHGAARAALEDAVGRSRSASEETDTDEEPGSFALPPEAASESDKDEGSSDVPQDYVPYDFDPARATMEVWSGQDPTMRANLFTFLRGIGIGSAADDSRGQLRIRVTPSDQQRALEMIRQVIDTT